MGLEWDSHRSRRERSNRNRSGDDGGGDTCILRTMGFDVSRFQGDVDEELVCPICSGVLEDPVQVGLSRVFDPENGIPAIYPFSPNLYRSLLRVVARGTFSSSTRERVANLHVEYISVFVRRDPGEVRILVILRPRTDRRETQFRKREDLQDSVRFRATREKEREFSNTITFRALLRFPRFPVVLVPVVTSLEIRANEIRAFANIG